MIMSFEDQKKVCVHHVGGRNGYGGFPLVSQFETDIIRVVYDADPTCIDQIKEINDNLTSEFHVLPYALSSYCGNGTLNITYDPHASSLLELNPTYASHYFSAGADYILEESFKTIEQIPVELVTLDLLCHSSTPQINPPDFISIDTQGTEYDILCGAEQSLSENILALVVEVEFLELYKGQKLFGDISALLSNKGFDFARFVVMGETYPFRYPIGLRGGTQFLSSGDALFFRRIDTLKHNSSAPIKLAKLAFFSILFEHFDYGLHCLECIPENEFSQICTENQVPSYLLFLKDFLQAAQRVPKIYPVTLAQVITFQENKARFDSGTHPFNSPSWQKVGQAKTETKASEADIKVTFSEGFSEIESVFAKWGLTHLATKLQGQRLSTSDRFLPQPFKRKMRNNIKASIDKVAMFLSGKLKNLLTKPFKEH